MALMNMQICGHNNEVMKILRSQKFNRCHVLVTSRPHSTKDLESYFNRIVLVKGFSQKEAKKFAFKILKKNTVVSQVMASNPGSLDKIEALNNCPILLSFLCLLVREDQIDLSNDKINTGEIYTRMVRCLYNKFVIRQKLEYEHADFVKVITAVGKIAFRTLITGNPLLRRSDVIKEIGPDAFDYGLLIGHEDAHRLIRDETADIFVTFPHRSLQEFLGAFFFIQALNKGESLDSLLGDYAEPLFMTNPSFLYFCLWLIQSSKKYFTFENLRKVRDIVESYILERIDATLLDFQSISTKFPAINISKIIRKNDKAALSLLEAILFRCHNVRIFRLESNDSLEWVLPCLRHLLPHITYIAVENYCVMRRVHDILTMQTLYSIERGDARKAQNILRGKHEFSGRRFNRSHGNFWS